MIEKARELSRLILTTQLPNQKIGQALNCSPTTVQRYRVRLADLSLDWASVEQLDDHTLANRINDGRARSLKPFVVPDWSALEREYRKPGVTQTLLHQEYISRLPPPGQINMPERTFNRRFADYRRRLGVSMRQVHKAGEKLFVDFSGKRISYRGPDGRPVMCEVFVATLGASGLTYVEAVRSQTLPDWTMAHARAFEFMGGAPQILVPDCLKSGVTSWREGPDGINPAYAELATHYGSAVIAARPGRPKDKAKVERSVQLAQRWILAALRNVDLFSLEEINAAISPLLKKLNQRPFKRRPLESRQSLFEALDRPALKPLPNITYEFGEWRTATVPADYHVLFDERAYSVPYGLVGKRVRVRASATAITVYHNNQVIATHPRVWDDHADSTNPAHQPVQHRVLTEHRLADDRAWALTMGPGTVALVEHLLASDRAPLIIKQALSGLRKIGKAYGPARLELACARGLRIGATRVRSIESMLRAGLETAPIHGPDDDLPPLPGHENVRGAHYFS